VFEGEQINWLRRRMIGLMGEELSNPTRTDAINSGWGKLFKTSLIKNNMVKWTSTNEVGSSDVLFNISIFKFVKKATYIYEFFNHYRTYNTNSLTVNYRFSLFPKLLNLFNHIKEIIRQDSL